MTVSSSPSLVRPFVCALLVAAGFLSLSACEGDYRPRAVGPEGEITVVMDSTHWSGAVGAALRANVGPYIETLPAPERYFQFRQFDLSSTRTYDRIQEQKNLIFIAPLSDTTNEANFLRRRLSADARTAVMNGQTAVVSKPNLWRQSQRVYFITARDAEGLVNALQQRGTDLRQTFQSVTLDRMEQEMFEKARQFDLEDSLLSRHDFAVNVQHDYQLVRDLKTDSTGLVLLRRVLSDTWRTLLIHYVEGAQPARLSSSWIYDTRDSLTRAYLRGNVAGFMRIDYRRPLTSQQTSFLDRYAYESQGLWHMVAHVDSVDMNATEGEFVEMGMGGPFVSYAFYDQPSDRLYFVDGSVFAPGFDKLQFVRQMEVIARTFRTRNDTEQPEPTVAARREE